MKFHVLGTFKFSSSTSTYSAPLGREPGLADHSVEENFSQEEHQCNIKRTLDILRAKLAASVGTVTAVVVGGAWVELKLDFTLRLPRF